MTVTPGSTDILANIFRKFDRLMETASATMLRSPAPPSGERNTINHIDDAERIKFGFDKDEWRDFLRRMGVDSSGNPDDLDRDDR